MEQKNDFHKTVMGQCFYNKQLPDLIKALKGIDDSLKKIAEGQASTTDKCNASLATSSLPSLYEKVPDSELVAAMNNDELCIALAEVFEEEAQSDDEPYRKKGYFLLKAVLENDVNGALVAICGWSIHTLLSKAKGRVAEFSAEEEPDDVVYVRTVGDILEVLEGVAYDCRTYCQSVSFAAQANIEQGKECYLSKLLYPSTENTIDTASDLISFLKTLPEDMPVNINCSEYSTVSLYPEKLNICF